MHETGIAERIVAVALERAREAGAQRITDLHLEVGELAGASPEAVAFHVEEAARGTLVEGARIHFEPPSSTGALRLLWIDVEDPEDRFAGARPDRAEAARLSRAVGGRRSADRRPPAVC